MKKGLAIIVLAIMIATLVPIGVPLQGGVDVVSAATGGGGGGGSSSSSYSVPKAPSALALPAGYKPAATEVKLVWLDNATTETGYYVERVIAGDAVWSRVATLAVDAKAYTDTNLKPNTNYKYRIVAFNANGNSAASNTLSVTTDYLASAVAEPGYTSASTWAKPEIEKAVAANLTVDKLLNNFTKPITREEFCEIVVKLYEATSGQTAVPVAVNPFADTTNTAVLKAYGLGIVKGVSDTAFAPGSQITRQEIAVMFMRELKAAEPDEDFSISSTAVFADQAKIASWALDAVRYMNQEGILNGTGEGNISPTGNTTREQAIALVVRTFEKFGAEDSTSTDNASGDDSSDDSETETETEND